MDENPLTELFGVETPKDLGNGCVLVERSPASILLNVHYTFYDKYLSIEVKRKEIELTNTRGKIVESKKVVIDADSSFVAVRT